MVLCRRIHRGFKGAIICRPTSWAKTIKGSLLNLFICIICLVGFFTSQYCKALMQAHFAKMKVHKGCLNLETA